MDLSADTGDAGLRIERLCGHHRCESFDCGDELVNDTLRECLARVNSGFECLAFVLTNEQHDVLGFIFMHDKDYVFVPDDDDERSSSSLRYCMIPAIGVTKSFQGNNAFFALVAKAIEVALERKARLEEIAQFELEHHGRRIVPNTYRGFLCIIFTSPKLGRLLERWGFEPFPLNQFYVWRAFPENPSVPSPRGDS